MKATLLFTFTLIFIFFASNSDAHKLNVYAYHDGDMVHSESYFADGSKCKNCTIVVYDKNSGRIILEGKTDENGKFSFRKPEVSSLKVILKGGAGHQAEYSLSLKKEKSQETKRLKEGIAKEVQDKSSLDKQKCLSSEEIEAVVNQAVERKMEPLMSQIASMHKEIERAGIIEIIGGIGYIFGIMGIIMYLKSRKINRQ